MCCEKLMNTVLFEYFRRLFTPKYLRHFKFKCQVYTVQEKYGCDWKYLLIYCKTFHSVVKLYLQKNKFCPEIQSACTNEHDSLYKSCRVVPSEVKSGLLAFYQLVYIKMHYKPLEMDGDKYNSVMIRHHICLQIFLLIWRLSGLFSSMSSWILKHRPRHFKIMFYCGDTEVLVCVPLLTCVVWCKNIPNFACKSKQMWRSDDQCMELE